MYIFIVWRLSILSKLDSNNPYHIWAELYILNLNYLIILDTWPNWPSWCPRRSRFTCWSYLSFRPILFAAHLLVWPSYGDNRHAVMSVTQVFPSLWCWIWLMLVLRVLVFHPSWCEVTVVRFDAVIWARLEWWRRLDSVKWCGLSCSNLLRTES
jgi:hypothetical protein